MLTPEIQALLVYGIIAFPAVAVVLMALLTFTRRKSESAFSSIVAVAFSTSTICITTLVVTMVLSHQTDVVVHVGSWFSVGHYHFDVWLVADRLSIPFAAFSSLLIGVIGAFSRRYLHREPGFFRFYFLLSLFGVGVEIVVLAGSVDLLFMGWEIVGLTSALLIAFFLDRRKPVEHGLRAFITYRFCDVGLLLAAVLMHHLLATSHITQSGMAPWDGFPVPVSPGDATLLGLLLLWASMGKAGQAPFGGWLPRAMEGPTPSSAIFYGAISIHLGPYLLLRAAPILEHSEMARIAVITVGAVTAIHGTIVGRVQTDIKSTLAYASITQVGLIFVEIGFGLRYIALIHIVGHAGLRTLQILRSPSLLHDHHHLEQAMGAILPRTGQHLERLVPQKWQSWLYRNALERGYFDALLRDWIIGSFVRFMNTIDAIDRHFVRWIAGAEPVKHQGSNLAKKADEEGEMK